MSGGPIPPAAGDHQDIDDLAGGAMVNLVGKLGRLLRALYLWVVAALFGAQVLGQYSLAWSIALAVGYVGRFGLQRGVPQFVIAARVSREQGAAAASPEQALAAALLVGTAVSAPLTLGLMAATPFIARFYADPQLAVAVSIMAWSVPLFALVNVLVEATRALRIMRFGVYVYSIAGPALLLLGGLAAAALDAGLVGLAWAQLLSSAGMVLLAAVYVARYYQIGQVMRALAGGGPWRPMVRFCFPVMLTDSVQALLRTLDVLMLGAYLAADQVGIYSAARRLCSVLLKVPQSFDPVFGPIVSDLAARGRSALLAHRFVALTRWTLTIDLAFVGAMLLAGRSLLAILGPEFAAGTIPLALLCVATVLQGVFAPTEPLLIMCGHPGLNLANNVLWLVAALGCSLALIPAYGMAGAAAAALIATVFATVLRLGSIYWTHRTQPLRWSQLKPVAAAAVGWTGGLAAGSLLGDGAAGETLAAATFLAVYVIGLRVAGLDPDDRAMAGRMLSGWRRRRQRLTEGRTQAQPRGS